MEIEIVFKNELNIQILDKNFYQKLLENIRLINNARNKNGNSTCACLDTSKSFLSEA